MYIINNYQYAENTIPAKKQKQKTNSLLFHPFLDIFMNEIPSRKLSQELCSMKLYTTRVTMIILATAPPICIMGACQNTD